MAASLALVPMHGAPTEPGWYVLHLQVGWREVVKVWDNAGTLTVSRISGERDPFGWRPVDAVEAEGHRWLFRLPDLSSLPDPPEDEADRIDETRLTLLAERGDPGGGLPGWTWNADLKAWETERFDNPRERSPLATCYLLRRSQWTEARRWIWWARPEGNAPRQEGYALFGREAMHAAEAVLKAGQ